MTLLSKDAFFLKAHEVKTRDVEVPGYGTMRVRKWNIAIRNEYLSRIQKEQPLQVAAWLVSSLVVDANGDPFFRPEEVSELEKCDPEAVDVLVKAIYELNKDKEIEAAVKN